MRLWKIILPVLITILIGSCKKDNVDPEPSDAKYYLIADIGPDNFKFESSVHVECYSFENIICYPFYVGFDQIGNVDFFDGTVDSTRGDYIEAMEGKTYPTSSNIKGFGLWLTVDGVFYSIENVDIADRTGSFNVTEVTADGFADLADAYGNYYRAYRVKGTFSCNMKDIDGNEINLTNGNFSFRLNESER